MTGLTLPAPSKLNLFLHINGQRGDGYHLLQTHFQLLDYGDVLTFSTRSDGELSLSCSRSSLAGDNNLVMKAARLLKSACEVAQGADIHLEKKLPAGGGLGGGSSDAATTLLALNRLWQCRLNLDQLAELGVQLGADVPVFVHGRTAWASGIGEELVTMPLPQRWYVVLTPDCEASTREIFSDPRLTKDTPIIRIPAFPISGAKNDCESVACSLYPAIRETLDWLGEHGDAIMTGTGSSVFAAFDSQAEAENILSLVPAGITGFVARGINSSTVHDKLLAQA